MCYVRYEQAAALASTHAVERSRDPALLTAAIIAWGLLGLFLVGTFAGTLIIERAYRLALAIFAVASTCGFAFAFLTGFSIGRFISLLPLVVTAFAVTRDRPPLLQLAGQLTAIGLWVLLAWIVDEQVHFWGIQIELPLCLVAYAAATIFPPPRRGLGVSVG